MLTDLQCRTATCPPERSRIRLYDSGGLYLEVTPNGSKRWMWKYRFQKREKLMAFGKYPGVTLTAARAARDRERLKKADGADPMTLRRVEKLRAVGSAASHFEAVAREWLKKQTAGWSATHAERVKRLFERDLFPYLGSRAMEQVVATEVLAVVQKIEARGALETASRALIHAGQVWRYAVATGRADRDVTGDLKGALAQRTPSHLAAITDPIQFGALLRATDSYKGSAVVRAALRLAPLVFQRPGELRAAEWSEFDLDAKLWTLPAKRMKRKKVGKEAGPPHYVPLSEQAISVLREIKLLTGQGQYVFPGQRDNSRPISDNSVRTALIAMGYTPDVHTWHGFRASARTMLAEQLDTDPLVIEAQLAHAVQDANGRAYNRTQYLKQRAEMMQRWADYLDEIKAGAVVIELKRA